MPKAREYLVIGCGHAHLFCDLSHPASTFETIDMNPKRKPDVLLYLDNPDEFAEIYQDRKFKSIIFEGMYLESAVPYLKEYIQKEGNLVAVGSCLFEMIRGLSEGERLFSIGSDTENFRPIHIAPQGNQFHIDTILQEYINSVTKNKKFQVHEIQITSELKQRAALLDKLHVEISRKTPYFPSGFVLAVLLAEPNKKPITAGDIKQMAETYSPGWLRRHTMGKTQGIVDLESFLSHYQEDQILGEEDLSILLKLMQDRQRRISHNLNPTRSADGSTTQVYKQITVAILNFWLSNFSNLSPIMGVDLASDDQNEHRL